MKPITHRLGGLLSASALALSLAVIAQPASAGISTSRHNLGSSAPGQNNHVTDTAEICVFCHTPHGSNTTVKAPLWNKYIINTSTSYTNYNSTNSITYDAKPEGPGPVSMACLSCHDGTQAMDNIINGSGYGNNFATGGGASGRAYTWVTGIATGIFPGAETSPFADGRMGNGVPMLGTDLSNDHPIGMNYAGCADADNVAPSGTPGSTKLTGCTTGFDPDFYVASATTANPGRRFVEKLGGDSVFQKTDLPLYGAGASGQGTGNNRVECATCHDPHTTDNPTFLRISNDGSGLCLTCHAK